MRVIVLAGGQGSRLAPVVNGVAKPMADMGGRPFLELVLDNLIAHGAREFIITVSHLAETVINHFGGGYKGFPIAWSMEREPLGTGGAIRQAMETHNLDDALIINGDTYLDADYSEFYKEFAGVPLALVLREVSDTSRYGRVETDNGRILAFREKADRAGQGLINAGVYRIDKSLLKLMPEGKFSLENGFLENYAARQHPPYMLARGYFIDIGLPESYARARRELGACKITG